MGVRRKSVIGEARGDGRAGCRGGRSCEGVQSPAGEGVLRALNGESRRRGWFRGLVFIREQACQIPRTFRRESRAGQSRLGGSASLRARRRRTAPQTFCDRMIVKRAALQQIAQFAPLFQDCFFPGTRPPVGLMLPFQKVGEQSDQAARHLASISFGHVRQVLAQVAKVQSRILACRREIRHRFQPGRFRLVPLRQRLSGNISVVVMIRPDFWVACLISGYTKSPRQKGGLRACDATLSGQAGTGWIRTTRESGVPLVHPPVRTSTRQPRPDALREPSNSTLHDGREQMLRRIAVAGRALRPRRSDWPITWPMQASRRRAGEVGRGWPSGRGRPSRRCAGCGPFRR